MSEYVWLVISIVLFAVEAFSAALICIWFAFGAAAAMVAAFCGANTLWQWIIFIAVSAVLLLFTRDAAKKWLTPKIQKTNIDSIIGEEGVVTEVIGGANQTGRVCVNSQSWRAKSAGDGTIESGETVIVEGVSGVTLTVRKKQQKKAD